MAQEYYASVKSRLAKYGRSQDSLRVMTGIMPVIGRTREEAQAKFDQLQELLDPRVANGMLMINQFPDLSAYGLDDKVPEAEVRDVYLTAARNPEVTTRLMQRARREGMTIRQLHSAVSAGFWHLGVIGTPTDVADTMQSWFEQGAADGFIVQPPCLPGSATDFVDMVIPELQRRGLFRLAYEGHTLRDNLGLPRVPSRYAT
jgi:alkanesulfonate monooxygenase SsuD/methylene tetrahydromethanopterin reductase-like flavin-dependent oxidoreductase (luciferase family)